VSDDSPEARTEGVGAGRGRVGEDSPEARAGSKVAAVTIWFWVLKVLATTLGETAGDWLSMTLDLGYVVGLAITATILAVALVVQVRATRFHAALFWTAIVATTTAGTEVSDLMDRTLGTGYLWGSLILAAGLAATLLVWRRREGHLRVFPIARRDVEVLFWIAVVFSNSLGTAFGDWLTDDAGLSYLQGALVTGAIVGVVVALHAWTRIDDVLLFWIAFVFTRPFGATFGDLLTKPIDRGGLSLSRAAASLVTLALLVTLLALSRKKGSGVFSRSRNGPSPDERA
jgi:uncharacterized membrane-anchored protein